MHVSVSLSVPLSQVFVSSTVDNRSPFSPKKCSMLLVYLCFKHNKMVVINARALLKFLFWTRNFSESHFILLTEIFFG